jgi:site-specific recombinase XerD
MQYLRTYEYASLRHVLFTLMWTTGIRVGTARGLNVGDYNSDEMYIDVVHRPEEGTPLKNKRPAERQIALHEWVCVIIDDYIEGKRKDIVDDYDRQPLFPSSQGRAHRTTLRKKITTLTRPCVYTNECPHNREIDDCEATKYNSASKCPGSVSPHPLRRSAITNFLNEGHSKEVISERMDVSPDVLEKHYDARSESEKRELRREILDLD